MSVGLIALLDDVAALAKVAAASLDDIAGQAAKAGASYVSPFIGRLDDISQDGLELIAQIRQIYDNYGYKTEILAASIRHTIHLIKCAEIGADVVTCPLKVITDLLNHPLTDAGLAKFLADHKKANS